MLSIVLVHASTGCASDPNEACTEGDPTCNVLALGQDEAVTTATSTGYRSVINGNSEFTWVVSGTTSEVQFRVAGRDAGSAFTIEGFPSSPEAAGVASMFLYRNGGDEQTAQLSLPVAPKGASSAPGNTSGCDQIHEYDCTSKGACCDRHDVCIDRECADAEMGCGNVLGALQRRTECPPSCLRCHVDVVGCFLTDPGPSHCCEDDNCNEPQRCIISGRVITDPCVCERNGIMTPAVCDEPPPDCIRNGGTFVGRPIFACCSGFGVEQSVGIPRSVCCLSAEQCEVDSDCCQFESYIEDVLSNEAGQCVVWRDSSRCVDGRCTDARPCTFSCSAGPDDCLALP
ncbi:MAG: hypothetical protein AAF436_06635 [Myxococcota bacterium]